MNVCQSYYSNTFNRMENRDSSNIPFSMQFSLGRFSFTLNEFTSSFTLLDFFRLGETQENLRKRGLDADRLAQFRCWKVRHTSYKLEIEQTLPDVWIFKRVRAQPNYPVIDTCSICLCDMNKGQIVRELPCKHTFHKKCIDKWLRQSNKCPVDRSCLD